MTWEMAGWRVQRRGAGGAGVPSGGLRFAWINVGKGESTVPGLTPAPTAASSFARHIIES